MQAEGRVRGVVLEQRGAKAVLLTPDGTFCTVRREPGWQVGEEVRAEHVPERTDRKLWLGLGSLGAVAAAAAVLAALVVVPAQARPVAYVNVYGANTVTLAVGPTGKVLGVTVRNGSVPKGIHPGLTAEAAVDILTRVEGGPVQPGTPSGVMVAMYMPKGGTQAPSNLAPMLAEVARHNQALFEAMPAPRSTGSSSQPMPRRTGVTQGVARTELYVETSDEA